MKAAFLASALTLPGSQSRRIDAFEHDDTLAVLRPSFARRGMSLEDLSWDDPSADWSSYGAVLIGTTWDYCERLDAFLATLQRIEAVTRLYNPLPMVLWNARKRYLRDLEAQGAPIVPTLWLDDPGEKDIRAAFDRLGTDTLVLKREVGANAIGQHRVARNDPLPALSGSIMSQPFLSAIQTEGEYSFIFIDNALCHAVIKRPRQGDYRIQSSYGGREEAVTVPPGDLAAAQGILGLLEDVPLYARVDMVRGENGALLLMELELIEPFLFPLQGPDLGERMAAALLRRLDRGPVT